MSKRAVTKEELERPLVSYQDALTKIVSAFKKLQPVELPLRDALGLVLAETVVAPIDVPGFDNSAMDGYAVRSADTPGLLKLVDDLPAGTSPSVSIESGTAAKIMTGAPLPPGADAVVPWEDTDRGDGEVEVLIQSSPGRHVRPAGEDLRAGDDVVAAGVELRAIHLGVIASIGLSSIKAHPRPRVAVLSTGDELGVSGSALKPGQVYDANRALLTALAENAGASVSMSALIGDDPTAIAAWLRDAARASDLIVTSGGASVGEHDWIRAILEESGDLTLWRIAIKPGKPIAFGQIDGTPVLGLPGNPGSAFVGAHVFVARAIRTMAGRALDPPSATARLANPVKGSPSRTLFCRVKLENGLAVPLPAQSSVVLSNLIPADAFAIIPPGGLPEGADVTVEMI